MQSSKLSINVASPVSKTWGEIRGIVVDQGLIMYVVQGHITLKHVENLIAEENDLLMDLKKTFGDWREIVFLQNVTFIENSAFDFFAMYLEHLVRLGINQKSSALVELSSHNESIIYSKALSTIYKQTAIDVSSFSSCKDALYWSHELQRI